MKQQAKILAGNNTGLSLILISLSIIIPLLAPFQMASGQVSGNPYLERPPLDGGGGGGGGLGGNNISQNLRPSADQNSTHIPQLTNKLSEPNNYCLSCLFSQPAETIFPDLKGHFARNGVQLLAETSSHEQLIVQGFTVRTDQPNEFRPEQAITRAEFLKMALLTNCIEIKKYSSANPPSRNFDDLPPDSEQWYKDLVYTASELGIVDGYSDGRFSGEKPISRAEAAKILVNVQNPPSADYSGQKYFQDVAADEWYYNFISAGREQGLLYGSKNSAGKDIFRPKSNISRGETAVMLARMLKVKNFVTFSDPDAHNYTYLRLEQIVSENLNDDLQSNLLGTLTPPLLVSLMLGMAALATLFLNRVRKIFRRKDNN